MLGVFSNSITKIYTKIDTSREEIITSNLKYYSNFGMTLTDKQKDLPIMYRLLRMHKTPTGCPFIVVSKQCSTKPLTKTNSYIFKMIYSHVKSFH